jgi:hypothetical protein
MSTQVHLLSSLPAEPIEHQPPQAPPVGGRIPWDPGRFAQEQIRRLVRQVFFPGWPRPARHIAFVAIDDNIDAGAICLQVGQILSLEIQANTCVVEANRCTGISAIARDDMATRGGDSLRNRARQLSSRLWLMPQAVFLEGSGPGLSPVWLESRLHKLYSDFDFTLLHLPAADQPSEAVLLGHLSDGVVLIVEAHSTRRVKAQTVKEIFQAANVKILGTVLNGRRFPIPEGIYRRL